MKTNTQYVVPTLQPRRAFEKRGPARVSRDAPSAANIYFDKRSTREGTDSVVRMIGLIEFSGSFLPFFHVSPTDNVQGWL